MEENKKSGGGDVRAFALSWDGEWDKARKLVFSFITTFAHGGALRSPLTSLAARKKKPLRGEKVGFAEKKTAPIACRTASCVATPGGGWIAFLGGYRSHDMAGAGGYRFFGFVPIWTKIGRFCGPKANMKHLKQLKHLKHLMWMPGLLFCKHFKELGGKVNDGVNGRQYQ